MWLGYAIGNVVGGLVTETWCAYGIGNVAVPFTLVGKLTYLRSRFVFGFFFCSRGSLTPVAAPNVFLAWGRLRRSGFGAIVLRDVA